MVMCINYLALMQGAAPEPAAVRLDFDHHALACDVPLHAEHTGTRSLPSPAVLPATYAIVFRGNGQHPPVIWEGVTWQVMQCCLHA
jgi:hypothetical protein